MLRRSAKRTLASAAVAVDHDNAEHGLVGACVRACVCVRVDTRALVHSLFCSRSTHIHRRRSPQRSCKTSHSPPTRVNMGEARAVAPFPKNRKKGRVLPCKGTDDHIAMPTRRLRRERSLHSSALVRGGNLAFFPTSRRWNWMQSRFGRATGSTLPSPQGCLVM